MCLGGYKLLGYSVYTRVWPKLLGSVPVTAGTGYSRVYIYALLDTPLQKTAKSVFKRVHTLRASGYMPEFDRNY